MTKTSAGPSFPKWFLVSVSALVLTAVAAAGFARLTGIGASRISETQVVTRVEIWFDPQPDGSMLIRRADDGATLEVLASDGGGFMRGVARSLLRQRQLSSADKTLPFTLSQRNDRRFFILDEQLGSKMELDGFGPSNTLSVDRVLKAGLAKAKSQEKQASSSAVQPERNAGAVRGKNGGTH
jgi:putative photosynthetic complex assembly protein